MSSTREQEDVLTKTAKTTGVNEKTVQRARKRQLRTEDNRSSVGKISQTRSSEKAGKLFIVLPIDNKK